MTRKLRINQVERDLQAQELLKSGATFPEIAQALGYANRSGAFKAVQRCLRAAMVESANEYRQILMLRLEKMFMAVWPQALQGNSKALDGCLKILARESRLLGLDAPTKVEVPHELLLRDIAGRAAELYGLDPAEVMAEAERILEETEE